MPKQQKEMIIVAKQVSHPNPKSIIDLIARIAVNEILHSENEQEDLGA